MKSPASVPLVVAALSVLVLYPGPGASLPRVQEASQVGTVLTRLAGHTWVFEGPSRHGERTRQISSWERGPGGIAFTGRSTTSVDNAAPTEVVALYGYHPRRRRWTYTSVSADGVVQEAEELESSPTHFVFKGTAYRPDGSQTSFVWHVSFEGPDTVVSRSMAFHEGAWRENPDTMYRRQDPPPAGIADL